MYTESVHNYTSDSIHLLHISESGIRTSMVLPPHKTIVAYDYWYFCIFNTLTVDKFNSIVIFPD